MRPDGELRQESAQEAARWMATFMPPRNEFQVWQGIHGGVVTPAKFESEIAQKFYVALRIKERVRALIAGELN